MGSGHPPTEVVAVDEKGQDQVEQLPCREWDPELFFPEHGDPDRKWVVATARTVCSGCSLRTECLELGMDERWGIWGGLTPYERRELRRRRRQGLDQDQIGRAA